MRRVEQVICDMQKTRDYPYRQDLICEVLIAWKKEIQADQDKITRHACAEAISSVRRLGQWEPGCDLISRREAHQACINAKGA